MQPVSYTHLAADPYGRAEEILHMIITMGNHMKLSIIAEGVETEQQKAVSYTHLDVYKRQLWQNSN